jgi:hypothetical protein
LPRCKGGRRAFSYRGDGGVKVQHYVYFAPGATRQPRIEERTNQIVAEHSGKCIDVCGPSLSSGEMVHQWGCYASKSQRWFALEKEISVNNFAVQLKVEHSGMCLNIPANNTANGTPTHSVPVRQWQE